MEEVSQVAFVVVDGGGTNLRAALFDRYLKEIGRLVVPNHPNGYEDALFALINAISELMHEHDIVVLDGIGFSVAGSTDGKTILAAGNLGAWAGMPIKSNLETAFRCPVWLFNDGQAMGASEYFEQQKPLILAIWGSGVNFCLVLGDDIYSLDGSGPSIVGEGGHQKLVEGGLQCGCGMKGCLEAYTGGQANKKRGKALEDLSEAAWSKVVGHMAHGVHNVIAFTNGQLPIFFAGGVICKQADRLPLLLEKLEPSRKMIPNLPPISMATHGEDAGLHGAAVIVAKQPTLL